MARPKRDAEIDLSRAHDLTAGLIERLTCPAGRVDLGHGGLPLAQADYRGQGGGCPRDPVDPVSRADSCNAATHQYVCVCQYRKGWSYH